MDRNQNTAAPYIKIKNMNNAFDAAKEFFSSAHKHRQANENDIFDYVSYLKDSIVAKAGVLWDKDGPCTFNNDNNVREDQSFHS